MALDLEERLKVFLASAPQDVHSIQTIELSHSAMSQTFYLWTEPYVGEIGVESDSGGVDMVEVQPINMEIRLAGTEAHLDQQFDISLDTTDINDEFRREMALIPLGTREKVRCVYREYLSDDLETIMAEGTLQVESISYELGRATLSAVLPRLNVGRTGRIYAPRDIPMLRGIL